MFKEKDLGIFVNILYRMLTKMPEKNAPQRKQNSGESL